MLVALSLTLLAQAQPQARAQPGPAHDAVVDAGPATFDGAEAAAAVDVGAGTADAGSAVARAPLQPADDEAGVPFNLGTLGVQQAVLVVTDSWSSTIGTLKRFEKVGDKWMQLGQPIEVVVGEGGLGWGLGLHPLGVGEPRKLEGDARAPAGVFGIASAFGRGAPAVKTKMPWLMSTPSLLCIDDPKSSRYNRIVEDDGAGFQTAEPLLREDGLYDVGLLVDHNALGDGKRNVIAGRGSCVFMHIWKRKGRPTDGCTAMARWDLEKLVEWLEPDKRPVLIQLTREEWAKRRLPWGLP